MTDRLTYEIGQARHDLVEARISARHASDDLEGFKKAFPLRADYANMGKSEDVRKIAYAAAMVADATYVKIASAAEQARDAEDRADTALECLLDERREAEQRTWAQLADYLRGRMDHIGVMPQQAVREATREAIAEDIAADVQPCQHDWYPHDDYWTCLKCGADGTDAEVIRNEAAQTLHEQVLADDAAREEMLRRARAETAQYYAEDKPRDSEDDEGEELPF